MVIMLVGLLGGGVGFDNWLWCFFYFVIFCNFYLGVYEYLVLILNV